jgi:hypothetical protein
MAIVISVLSLIVTVLVALIAPQVNWALARQQIVVAAREKWMRELREQVALLLSHIEALERHDSFYRRPGKGDADVLERRLELEKLLRPPYNTIRLLIAERGREHDEFLRTLGEFLKAQDDQIEARAKHFTAAAAELLERERAAIVTDPGMWHTLWSRFGFRQ